MKKLFSADGRYVVVGAEAFNLVPGDTNDYRGSRTGRHTLPLLAAGRGVR